MPRVVALSVVIPFNNEADSLPMLWAELDEALRSLPEPTEVIFVDDGSTDGGASIVRHIMARDARVRLVRLAANAGLSAAFHAGFTRARGDIVATMDSDLQNDPGDIARLLAGLDGADAVVGWRRRRRDPWLKRISSRFANAARNALTDETIKDSACSLRVMRRECLEAIPPFHGMHRFVPTLLRLRGFRVIEAPVDHRPRRFGYSKYGIRNRALRTLLDLLVVRWMMTRIIRYDLLEEDGDPMTAARPGSRRAAAFHQP